MFAKIGIQILANKIYEVKGFAVQFTKELVSASVLTMTQAFSLVRHDVDIN